MAVNASNLFDRKTLDLADFAKALGHPARIAIVTTLMTHDRACCGELVHALPLAQATVSQHLRALQRAGLILGTPDGPRVHYTLNRDRLRLFCHAFGQTLGTADNPPARRSKARPDKTSPLPLSTTRKPTRPRSRSS